MKIKYRQEFIQRAQGFPNPEVNFSSLEFLKHTWKIVLLYWNMSDFPLLKNQQLINPCRHICTCRDVLSNTHASELAILQKIN